METSQLAREVTQELMEQSMGAGGVSATSKGAKSFTATSAPQPVIMTRKGPVPVEMQLTLERRVERGEEGEHTTELMTGLKPQQAEQLELTVQHL